MKINLIPRGNFDKQSVETINKLGDISNKLLSKWKVPLASSIEFYDQVDLFIKRILPQVKNYGLTRKQAEEFIKASLNSGSYGTFDIKRNTIIEMNFNPYFKGCYPAIHFLNLIIHESLHLFLYSKLSKHVYNDKFKFKEGKYVGNELIIQLDEGFAEVLTEEILKGFNLDKIKNLPIYSGINIAPQFNKFVEKMNIIKLDKDFNELYKSNSKKGYNIIKNEWDKYPNIDRLHRIDKLIQFIDKKIN